MSSGSPAPAPSRRGPFEELAAIEPSKLYFRIGEVAAIVGVESHVLRYWEREFRNVRPTKSAKGQRVYSRRDLENLLRIRDLLYKRGFTVAGAKKQLATARQAAPEIDVSGNKMRQALVDLRSEIEGFLAEEW